MQTKTLLLLANGFEIFEASVFIDVLGWNRVEGDKTTELVICGFQREIKGTFGVTLIADVLIDEIDVADYDALAIPGGFEEFQFYNQSYSDRFTSIIRQFNNRKKPIASICTGALPIGKSGALKGRKGTTYNQGGVRQKQLGEWGVSVQNEPIVVDQNIITSWNPSTAVDVAFTLLERLTSEEQAKYVKSLMGF